MEFNLETNPHPVWILASGAEGLSFRSGVYNRPLIIHYQSSEVELLRECPPHPRDLTIEDFGFLTRGRGEDPFEILVIGTGGQSLWLTADVSEAINASGIGIEAATTTAAARVFNVLLTDYRRVVALMFPVSMAPANPPEPNEG